MVKLALSRRLDAYALLKTMLGAEELPEPARREGGKPWFPSRPEVHFSLSHSGDYALCALSDAEIGADVETIRPRRAIVLQRALSGSEYAWVMDRGGRWEDFYTLWTLKEARVKQSGAGLRTPPRSIAVPLLAPGESGVLDGLTFTAYGGEGWRAALCAAEAGGKLQWVPAEDLSNPDSIS